MCARRLRAIAVCRSWNDWREVIAGEEMVPGAEDEHTVITRGDFLGPSTNRGPIPGQIRSLWENAKRSAHITQIPLCSRYMFEVVHVLLVIDSLTNLIAVRHIPYVSSISHKYNISEASFFSSSFNYTWASETASYKLTEKWAESILLTNIIFVAHLLIKSCQIKEFVALSGFLKNDPLKEDWFILFR